MMYDTYNARTNGTEILYSVRRASLLCDLSSRIEVFRCNDVVNYLFNETKTLGAVAQQPNSRP